MDFIPDNEMDKLLANDRNTTEKDFISDDEMDKLLANDRNTKEPDFISDEEMQKLEQQTAQPKSNNDSFGKKLEAAGIGAARGATFNFLDEIEGVLGGVKRAGQQAFGMLPKPQGEGFQGVKKAFQTGYQVDRDASRAYQKQLQESNPGSSIIGEIASGLPAIGAKSLVKIPSMIAQGAVSGIGAAEGDALQQAKGAATGGAISGALGLAGKNIEKIGESLDKIKNDNLLKSVGFDKGLLNKISKKMSLEIREKQEKDLAEYILKNKFADVFSTTPGRQKKLDVTRKTTGEQIGFLRKSVTEPFNAPKILENVKKSFDPNELKDIPENSAVTRALTDLEKNLLGKSDKLKNVRGTDLAKSISFLNSNIKTARAKVDEADMAALGKIKKTLNEILESKIQDRAYPKFVKDYAMQSQIGKALENLNNKSLNSAIGLGGIIGATGAGAYSANQKEVSPGAFTAAALLTPLGRRKLGEAVAKGINTGNNIVNKVPMSVKQFASKSGINPEVLLYLASKPSISQN
jgi:hypothetical protein